MDLDSYSSSTNQIIDARCESFANQIIDARYESSANQIIDLEHHFWSITFGAQLW